MTAAKRRDLAKSFSRNASELELQIELHATGRLCGDCASKEFGSDRPNVSDVVPVIQNIERIQRDGEDPGFLVRLPLLLSMDHGDPSPIGTMTATSPNPTRV